MTKLEDGSYKMNKIDLIKLIRETTVLDLAECKFAVEDWQASEELDAFTKQAFNTVKDWVKKNPSHLQALVRSLNRAATAS